MAVMAMWKCDRDGSMFEDKKSADEYDKMLELAENFGAFLQREVEGIDESAAENIGLLLSKNKQQLVAACKGKPELLLEIGQETDEETSNVTAIAAKG